MDDIWTEYAKVIGGAGVPADRRAWYQRWCEGFRRHLNGRSFVEAVPDDVKSYLKGIVRSAKMSQWQVDQAHEALILLLGKTLNVPWTETETIPVPQHQDVEGEADNRWDMGIREKNSAASYGLTAS